MSFVVSTFYKFVDLPSYIDLKAPLLKFCSDHKLKGTIILSPEGMNATVSGKREGIDAIYKYFQDIPEFSDMEYKESISSFIPFQKTKVLLKKEVIAMKVNDLDLAYSGEYLEAKEWNEKLASGKTVIVDTRNDCEVAFGTFKGAVNPKTQRFSDFPAWAEKFFHDADKDTEILMFCTGGIRCEKSTAYMSQKLGFKKVFHLKGGILQYLQDTKNQNSMWQGSCFVFDDRLALNNELESLEEDLF